LSQKANKHLNKNVAPIAESFSNFALSEKNLILYFDINGANEQTDTLNIPYSDLSNMLLAFNDIGILPEPITPAKTPTEAATEAPPTAPTETIIATQATTEAIVQTPSSSETPQVQAQAETTKPAPICADNLIAITFDDGPNPKTTPILLDGLKERNVKATFFTLGINMENNPDIITRMHDEGHLIANHSYNHQNLVKLDYDDMEKQYNTPNTILNSIIGTNTTLFRPPYGNYNDCVKQISNTPIILWSIDPKDWKYRNADTVSNHIIERAKDGDIILLHDIHPTSVQAALQTIDALKEKGFTFVTVDELIRRDGYEPQPGEIFGCKRKD
jgi:peptidoglycan/xylan/chitin deacetylase (PgdA/CDA1 family)